MTATVRTITCDTCGLSIDVEGARTFPTVNAFRLSVARHYLWRYDGTRDLCPKCLRSENK